MLHLAWEFAKLRNGDTAFHARFPRTFCVPVAVPLAEPENAVTEGVAEQCWWLGFGRLLHNSKKNRLKAVHQR